VSKIQNLCTHVCKCNNDTCCNHSMNGEGRERGAVEGVNSCMIYLIHCKNPCKCCHVPPPITTIKEKK
jgi:hypothetical protein